MDKNSTAITEYNKTPDSESSGMQVTLHELKGIVQAGFLTEEQNEPLLHQLQASEERFNDSKLNLAIIGEFSSGKSTFINALFQREILSTNMQPTTAVPTYITWDNEHTDSIYGQYEVTVYDNNKNEYSLVSDEGRDNFEAFANISLPEDPDRLIDSVTTDNRLTDLVSRVTIKAPVDKRYRGICLIDTPGINPGTEGTNTHVRVTQEVLRDAADAAIIMFPADQVYTASFGRFLNENASHLLRHSIFVITKCDILRTEQEQKDLCVFVAHHLSQIGVTEPEVHCISASCALDACLEPGGASGKEKLWQKRFDDTIKSIFKELASRRSNIVHENVTNVANEITRLLTDELTTKRTALNKARHDLDNSSPEKMSAECDQLLKECMSKMLEKKNAKDAAVSDLIGSAIEKERAESFSYIASCDDKEEVSDYLKRFDLSAINKAVTRNINLFNKALKVVFEEYKQNLGDCYSRYSLNISVAQVETLQLGNAENIDAGGVSASVSGFIRAHG